MKKRRKKEEKKRRKDEKNIAAARCNGSSKEFPEPESLSSHHSASRAIITPEDYSMDGIAAQRRVHKLTGTDKHRPSHPVPRGTGTNMNKRQQRPEARTRSMSWHNMAWPLRLVCVWFVLCPLSCWPFCRKENEMKIDCFYACLAFVRASGCASGYTEYNAR
jgi:hypothetical protein